MTEKNIPSNLIKKLSHNIFEIRERALFTIISKLDNGLFFENNLSHIKNILAKLFEWFLYDPCPHEEIVLALIKRILLTENAVTIIKHIGVDTIKKDLKQVHACIEPKYHKNVEELIKLVDNLESSVQNKHSVPPLVGDTPLSYRSGQCVDDYTINTSSETAASVAGYISKKSSVEAELPNENNRFTITNHDNAFLSSMKNSISEIIPFYTFKWQPLIEADRHVLNSIERSLRDYSLPSAVLNSCDFFTDVLLRDFPVELFLQRPNIVLILQDLIITTNSSRIIYSISNCFLHLTKGLQKRINHYKDPCMKSLNKQFLSNNLVGNCSEFNEINRGELFENEETANSLKLYEMPTPKFCLATLKSIIKYMRIVPETIRSPASKKKQPALNILIVAFRELLILLKQCYSHDIWNYQIDSPIHEIIVNFGEFFEELGQLLENYRIEVSIEEEDFKFRALYLCLLHNVVYIMENFVPEKKYHIVPFSLKNAIVMNLLDVPVAKLYPEIHNKFLEYVKYFETEKNSDLLAKYSIVKDVCESITAAIKFLKKYNKLNFTTAISLANDATLSLQFHKNLLFLDVLVDICEEKYLANCTDLVSETVDDVIVKLLSYHQEYIREYMYGLCRDKVISAVGHHLHHSESISSSHILFLVRSKILIQIAQFGINDESSKVKQYAEEIITLLLKCKIMVPNEIWKKVIVAFLPALPLLLVYSSKQTIFGRILINSIDPDIAKDMSISVLETIKSNIILLFCKDTHTRDEAFSRLAWMLAMQESSKRLLPKLHNIHDKTMSNICQLSGQTIEINRTKSTEHFYQPSSLIQVIELLKSSNIEPGIRRSALTQIAVMMEDYLLHELFLEKYGTTKLIEVLKSSLVEDDYLNYPDSVIPIISIFKNICLYNSSARHSLSNNVDMFYCILRSLFLYLTEMRLKQDSCILLFLLLYSPFIKGSPARGNLCVPKMVMELINVPFKCDIYGQTSENASDDLVSFISSDQGCLSSIQIHWNSELKGGFNNLLKNNADNSSGCDENREDQIKTPKLLKLNFKDLNQIKISNLDYSIRENLNIVQKAVDPNKTIEALNGLIVYVYLYGLSLNKNNEFILKHNWELALRKFLTILPSSEEDSTLLLAAIKLLIIIVPFYKTSETTCWISQALKESSTTIIDLLQVHTITDPNIKHVSRQLLNLISVCVSQEQHYLDFNYDFSTTSDSFNRPSWGAVIEVITNNLNLSDTQQFYNLAFLDSLLSCLVHLSATLGWSKTQKHTNSKLILKKISSGLCDLIDAFHHGKGETAADSVMGLSITRNALLILNHVLAELKAVDIEKWDSLFIDDLNEADKMSHFVALWKTRDIVLKAAAMQFFVGLLSSRKLTIEIISDLKVNKMCLWNMTLNIYLDHEECSIVRENAVLILANLCSHCLSSIENATLTCDIYPLSDKNQNNINISQKILSFFQHHNFFEEFKIILYNLYTISKQDNKIETRISPCISPFSLYQSTENSLLSEIPNMQNLNDKNYNITTPSLIKSSLVFLYNLSEIGGVSFINELKNNGIIKLIFRCICYPAVDIKYTKDVAFYCEILEMNITICSFLSRCSKLSFMCLGTVLNTKDCINVLVALLNSDIYLTYLPQLLYLRNKLWTEIYNLLTTLIEAIGRMQKSGRLFEVLMALLEAIHISGHVIFVETLCHSIGSLSSTDLQKSAITCLVFLLQAETTKIAINNPLEIKTDFLKKYSMQNLCDVTKITACFDAKKKPEKSQASINESIHSLYKLNLLENLYFNESKAKEQDTVKDNPKKIKAGAEICKILLHLYQINGLASAKENIKSNIIFSAISSLLCVSNEAKNYALDSGFLNEILDNVKEIHVKLSLESVDCFRRVADKKRVTPMLKHLDILVGLLTNFLLDSVSTKCQAVTLGLADKIHKLWVWFSLQRNSLINVLKMLCNFTTNCPYACQSLPYTSPLVGTGPRKVANNISLLNAIMSLISKEMDLLSKTHDVIALQLCFDILSNASSVLECRVAITKSSFIQCITRLHPAITRRQKPWDSVELIWLNFLQSFTIYPEGQLYVGKLHDILELFVTLASGSKQPNQLAALVVLQNVGFYPLNRSRLLTMNNFLNLLFVKLENGSIKEKNLVVTIMWALAANNTKAKCIFKTAKLDYKLQDVLKKLQIFGWDELTQKECEKMHYVLDILRD